MGILDYVTGIAGPLGGQGGGLLNMQDPAVRQGLLQFGLSLLQSKGGLGNALGQAGMQGLQGSQQYRQNQLLQKRQGLQDEFLKNQLDQQRREAEIAKLPGQFFQAPSSPVVDATGGMETAPENPANSSAGGFNIPGYTNALMGLDPLRALQFQQATAKQEPALREIDPTKSYGTWQGGRFTPVMQGKPKEDLPNAVQEYKFAVGQGYKGSFEQWDTARKKAGATNLSVSTGQKGFDNTLKLRSDFRSEPIYKAHQDVTSAYAQIKQSLKQESPAGDLAGATKIMKLLDPGSVVRESELGMAMAASGLMDRVQNYGQMVISGQKLTPTQRKDFQRLADALFKESAVQYNAKRREYGSIAERNKLNTEDVVGPESAAAPTSVDDLVNKYRSK